MRLDAHGVAGLQRHAIRRTVHGADAHASRRAVAADAIDRRDADRQALAARLPRFDEFDETAHVDGAHAPLEHGRRDAVASEFGKREPEAGRDERAEQRCGDAAAANQQPQQQGHRQRRSGRGQRRLAGQGEIDRDPATERDGKPVEPLRPLGLEPHGGPAPCRPRQRRTHAPARHGDRRIRRPCRRPYHRSNCRHHQDGSPLCAHLPACYMRTYSLTKGTHDDTRGIAPGGTNAVRPDRVRHGRPCPRGCPNRTIPP